MINIELSVLSAYVAGLIDGDGCLNLTLAKDTRGKNLRYYPRSQIVITSGSKSFLEKVKKLLGFGSGPYQRAAGFGGFVYDIHFVSFSDVERLVQMIDPYIIGKRRELDTFKEGLKYLRQQNPDIKYFKTHYMTPLQILNKKRGD